MSSGSHQAGNKGHNQPGSGQGYDYGDTQQRYPSPVYSQPHSQEPLYNDGVQRPHGYLDAGAISEGDQLGKLMRLPTESEAGRRERALDKGDMFDARIQEHTANPAWNRSYRYAQDTGRQPYFKDPNTRATTPSDYYGAAVDSDLNSQDSRDMRYLETSRATGYQFAQGVSQQPFLASPNSGATSPSVCLVKTPSGSEYGGSQWQAGSAQSSATQPMARYASYSAQTVAAQQQPAAPTSHPGSSQYFADASSRSGKSSVNWPSDSYSAQSSGEWQGQPMPPPPPPAPPVAVVVQQPRPMEPMAMGSGSGAPITQHYVSYDHAYHSSRGSGGQPGSSSGTHSQRRRHGHREERAARHDSQRYEPSGSSGSCCS